MNAAVDRRRLEIRAELESLRDRQNIAFTQRDKWPQGHIERQFWNERIEDLSLELNIVQARMKVLPMPGDGGPDEQRRLEAREDAKREYDEYA